MNDVANLLEVAPHTGLGGLGGRARKKNGPVVAAVAGSFVRSGGPPALIPVLVGMALATFTAPVGAMPFAFILVALCLYPCAFILAFMLGGPGLLAALPTGGPGLLAARPLGIHGLPVTTLALVAVTTLALVHLQHQRSPIDLAIVKGGQCPPCLPMGAIPDPAHAHRLPVLQAEKRELLDRADLSKGRFQHRLRGIEVRPGEEDADELVPVLALVAIGAGPGLDALDSEQQAELVVGAVQPHLGLVVQDPHERPQGHAPRRVEPVVRAEQPVLLGPLRV